MTMMHSEVLQASDRVLNALAGRIAIESGELLALCDADASLVTRCLVFLQARDHILVAEDGPTLYARERVVAQVLERVRESEPTIPAEIASSIGIPVAIACEALGWLEREGRVVRDPDGITFRSA